MHACMRMQVESTIVELGHMFNKMSTLVAAQGETIDRIDADMDQSYVLTWWWRDHRMHACTHARMIHDESAD